MELSELRKQIDEIDKNIVKLVNERYSIVLQVGAYKKAQGLPIRVPEREEAVLQRVCAMNEGPVKDETLRKLYRLLMDSACELEEEV